MNIIEKINQEFSEYISSCEWKNTHEGRFLSIELNTHELSEVTEITQKINTFVDQFEELGKFYLDIYSKGCDIDINEKDLDDYIDTKIELSLIKPYKDEYKIVIKLLENRPSEVYGIKNNKGRMQKISIEKNNITKIQKVLFK